MGLRCGESRTDSDSESPTRLLSSRKISRIGNRMLKLYVKWEDRIDDSGDEIS